MFDYEYWGHDTLSINENMALEELLLKRNVSKDSVVLGYGEATSALKKRDQSFDVTRRITGGSHVQFDNNCFAYTFTVPRDGSFKHYDEMRKYYAEKVAEAMQELGIEVSKVDNRASTINVDQKVVASHAMFWGVKNALMHGLMIISPYDVDRIFERVSLNERRIGKHVYTEYDALKSIPTIGNLMNKKTEMISRDKKAEYVKKLLADEILKQIARDYQSKKVTENILKAAKELVEREHTGELWVDDRNPPLTKDKADTIPGEELDGALKKNLGYCMYIEVPDKDFKEMAEPKE